MSDTTQDQVAAHLAELNEKTALRQQANGLTERLLDAVQRVLALADGSYVMLGSYEAGHREPMAWDLDPEEVKAAISAALLGEGTDGHD